ncbi:MAG: hypothetical protein ACJ75B_21240 [Flavisolibacter sp.]
MYQPIKLGWKSELLVRCISQEEIKGEKEQSLHQQYQSQKNERSFAAPI